MGRPALYSRFKKFIRARDPWGSGPFFNEFEVWGTNNPKPLLPEAIMPADRIANLQYWTEWPEVGGTDAWKDDWIKLGEYSIVPPSGQTTSMIIPTPEDVVFFSSGIECEIDPDKTNVPCRYLRFVCKRGNWSVPFSDQLAELQFFGQYVD